MLDPVSTRTVFSWPRAAVVDKIVHPSRTAKNLYNLVRTRPLYLPETFKSRVRRTNNVTTYTTSLAKGSKGAKGGESTVVWNLALNDGDAQLR
jgi:hypothetical protein